MATPAHTQHIRWMIRRDMPEVLRIEGSSFEFPWSQADFIETLQGRNSIGMVVERDDERIVGYMIYTLHKQHLHLLNFAVDATARLEGVGRQMVEKLISKLWYGRRTSILAEVRETNLAAQLFFRRQGFRAISVVRNFYDDTPEDAYVLEYRLPPLQSANELAVQRGAILLPPPEVSDAHDHPHRRPPVNIGPRYERETVRAIEAVAAEGVEEDEQHGQT